MSNFYEYIEIVKDIQEKYPESCVGGSVGLFLHQMNILIPTPSLGDIDIISKTEIRLDNSEIDSRKMSSDFDYSMFLNNPSIKIDVKIQEGLEYDIITFNNFDFKVCKLYIILKYIYKYAIKYNHFTKYHNKVTIIDGYIKKINNGWVKDEDISFLKKLKKLTEALVYIT